MTKKFYSERRGSFLFGEWVMVCSNCKKEFPYRACGRFGSFSSAAFAELWNHGVACPDVKP